MKKAFSLLVLFALVFALLTACGGNKQPVEIREPLSFEDDETFYNCYGTDYNLYLHNEIDIKPFGYYAGTLFADMALDRLKEVEQNLNCHLHYKCVSDILDYVRTTSATGTTDADIVYCNTGYYLMNLALGGLLHDYTQSDVIDTLDTAKYGPLNLQESIMIDGITYGLIPMKWANKSYEGNIGSFICFNEGIIREQNMPNPRELHEQKKWWATEFTEILPEYAILEGESKIYALAGHKSNFIRGVLGANGMRMVAEQDGNLVEAFDTPQVLTMLTWAQDFITKNQNYINFISTYTVYNDFINQTCTLAVIETQWIDDISLEVYDFGLLPFPCGPDIEYDQQVTFFTFIDAFAIPTVSQEPEAVEHILVPLLEPFEGYEDEESILSLLDNSLFFNHEDTMYYASLYKNTQSQYYAVDAYTFMETFANQLTVKSAAELISSLKGCNDECIEKYIAANYYYIKENS